MTTLLLNRADNFTKGIHKIKYEDCDCFLENETVKDDLIKYKFLSCNKDYSNTFKFSNMISINLFCC